MSWVLEHGSYALFFAALLVAGFGVPIPEDIVLLAAGALSHRGVTRLPLAAAVCFIGVLAGDAVLFLSARKLGAPALETRFLRGAFTPARRAWLERLLARHGGLVVFVARHLPGLRAPVFALSGAHGLPLLRFLACDALALMVTGPIVFGLGYLFSDRLDVVRRGIGGAEHIIVVVGVAVLAVVVAISKVRAFRRARV